MSEKAGVKKKVLIIDDSEFVRNKLKNILEGMNFEVVGVAEDGLKGINQYRELRPDIVTIDMVMPSYLKGLDCLRILKKLDPDLTAIMVTSVSDQKTVLQCIREGAKNYILKPFDEKKIKEVMEDL
ncbi:MAG: response regulator [Nitrospirae bacterium]|nr:response regulator [Nitrospirota bacterium]MBI3593607.1 response regulator [Nitrospirota bacterium]